MNILLTGSTGFIGRRLTRALHQQGHTLGLLVRRASLAHANQLFADLSGITLIEADITRNDVLTQVSATQSLLQGVDAIIHLAGAYDLAIPLEEAYAHNVIGTQNMVWLAQRLRGLSFFHHISTYAVNSHCQGHVGEDHLDTTVRLADHYAQTKLQAESIVRQARWNETKVRIYRPGVVVGDSQTGKMDKIDGPYYFFRLFNQMRKWQSITRHVPFFAMVGRPGAQVPLLPVNVLADWLSQMVTSPTAHPLRAYHLVSQEELLVEHFLRDSLKAFGLPIPIKRLPETRLLNPVLPWLGIPQEVAPYLYSAATFSREHMQEDFPQLVAPVLQDCLPRLVAGAQELFG